LSAEIPVDQSARGGLDMPVQNSITSLIRVDFHVPALPVRNIQLSHVSSCLRNDNASGLSFRFFRIFLYLDLASGERLSIFSIRRGVVWDKESDFYFSFRKGVFKKKKINLETMN